MKHRLTFTDEEIKVMADRLEYVKPMDYDLHTYAILRNLYGRFSSILLHLKPAKE